MIAFLCGLLLTASLSGPAQDAGPWSASVGVPVEVRELVLPGPLLEPVPQSVESPVRLRMVSVSPHGTAFRYDLEVFGLDPGTHDLRDFLQTVDGSPMGAVPELEFTTESVLPPGRQKPSGPRAGRTPSLGGYRTTLVLLSLLWTGGLVAFIVSGRRRRLAEAEAEGYEETAADRLRPLVQAALDGRLDRDARARLELNLIALWRQRLGLEELSASEALGRLRGHAEAGPLLQALEEWLHRPEPPADVDLSSLLEPYRSISATSLDRSLGASGLGGSMSGGEGAH